LLPLLLYAREGQVIIRSKELNQMPETKIKIYNMKGQLVTKMKSTIPTNYLIIPFLNKSSGTYLAKIECEGSKAVNKKFTYLR